MKRISIALAALGLSAGALAALPAATDPTLVAVPQLPGGFVIGVTGFYLQPSDTNGDLDYASVNTGTSSSFASSLRNVEPGYDWGYGINVGYIFPNTGNDVNLSWFSFSTDDNASTSIPFVSGGSIISPIFSNPFGFTTITSAYSKAEYDLNQVDLTAGQFIDVGCRLILHPNVGLRWADLERKLNSSYFGPNSLTTTTLNSFGVAEKSDFSGIGPLVGIDASYYIGMGFGAVAHFDSALLVGSIDSSTNTVSHVPQSAAGFFNSFNADDTQRVVPVMDAKLGLDYTYVFNNAANSDLTLEAGWMVSNYFNAVDRLHVTTGSTGLIAGRTTSDVGIEGPYISLQFHA